VIAVDSGFLYALADRRDAWHVRAVAAATTQPEGWITTWPVIAEACHLLGGRLGVQYAAALLEDAGERTFELWDIPAQARRRLPALMRKYSRLPMDLADASLVLLAEHLGHGHILTTDQRDFGAYRWKSRKPFRNLLEHMP
jgi:predicted nucleic acid-binding protein